MKYLTQITTGSAPLFNIIRPSGSPSDINFPNDGDVAYVVLSAPTSLSSNFTVVQSYNTVHGSSSGAGNIYVCPMRSIVESLADVFIIAKRVGTDVVLWNGDILKDGKEEISVGANYDRALLSQQYDYTHNNIQFNWNLDGTADSAELAQLVIELPFTGQAQ